MRSLVLAALVALAPLSAMAQGAASLVADRVRIEADRTLVAEGNVEVFYEDVRLTARRVTFDGKTEALAIEGPLSLAQADGQAVLVADAAALEPGLRNGVLRGARLVLDQQLQVAAAEAAQIDGRYRRLTGAVASSCRVCARGDVPLWEVRAARVLHDTETRQLYFSRAQFRVAGVPVAYIPRLRLPDPSVERARGFLVPELRESSELGTGLRVPYFVPLGRSADLTVAPWLATRTRTVELRYRQAFRRGSLTLEGAVSRDDLRPDGIRAFVFGRGRFDLPAGFDLDVRVRASSDDEYLDTYGYSGAARLASEAAVERVRPNELIHASLTHYEFLRLGALTRTDRTLKDFGQAAYERVWGLRGGRLRLGLDATRLDRSAGGSTVGRDVTRVGAGLNWSASTVLGRGFVVDAEAELRADAYRILRDPDFGTQVGRTTPAAAVALRWPLARRSGGTLESLEPVAQITWAEVSGGDVPNEDSRTVEIDEGNLLALDRFPGRDRSDEGARLNFGIAYSRLDASGRELRAVLGRTYAFSPREFPEAGGLDEPWSDWFLSGQVRLDDRLTVTNRALFDDGLSLTRNELRLAFRGDRARLAGTYVWLGEDAGENRLFDIHEAAFEADLRLSRHWLAGLDGRYDFETDRTSRAGLDLTYRNECLTVDLSLSRRFSTAASVEPTYDFGVEVSLAGFGAGDTDGYGRVCSG